MTPAQRLSLALATRGFAVPAMAIEECLYQSGTRLFLSAGQGAKDHIAKHAELSEKADV